ncbi:transposase [Salinarchaeum sp. IM2453]|uniref:transposase n=1 Tax=Salinarchaeum sp. IM2453 TaxID=2862870 RepID=UPI001C82F650|nr:transposase [Salinarchaeum sp. IM2453]QZA89074.1 transposase [Salinarchaeum sp. IM2453]
MSVASKPIDRPSGDVTNASNINADETVADELYSLLDAAEEPIELVYFPTGSPDLNPAEEYWRQLKKTLGNRYFATLDEIRSAIWNALETISPPSIYQYLCP